MPQLFGPRRPFPAPLELSPPLDPPSMPPPPAPPLAAVKKMRKMRLHLPYAVNRVERAWGMAMIGLHILTCSVTLWIWLFDSIPEEARFWIWLYLCLAAAMVVITCVDICCDPQPQQLAPAATVLLPPPPPEMDMC